MRWTATLLLLTLPAWAEAPRFKLADGDRIVFLGGALVERDQSYGYFESLLTLHFKDVRFTFRNLGWSGDTVWGEARAGFGTPKEGYASLLKQVAECKPTVLLVNYGQNESFVGEAGLQKFIDGYSALLDDLSKHTPRIWLITPNRQENLGRPLPDPAEHNKQLALYCDAIRKLAAKRGYGFVDLVEMLPDGTRDNPPRPLTDNGIHFNDYGSRRFAAAMAGGLGLELSSGASSPDEHLRSLINQKNREYFYRWRPQNETYIFGFRKHEQGQNAVEIPQFDPIVEKLEAEIHAVASASRR